MSTSTIAVIPADIRKAVGDSIFQFLPPAAREYQFFPRQGRARHIYEALQAVYQWWREIPDLPDTFAIATELDIDGYLTIFWSLYDA